MKARLLSAAIACVAALCTHAYAQPGAKAGNGKTPGQRSPADQALNEFSQVYGDPKGNFDQARFQKVMDIGFAFLAKYPSHPQAPSVAFGLGSFGAMMKDKAVIPMRTVYASQLKYEVLNQRDKEGVSPEGQAAITTVDVALADFEARVAPSRDNVATLREKINRLGAMPDSARFLTVAELSYADLLVRTGKGTVGEDYLRKLTEHPNKELAARARDDLNFIEMRKEPFAAKFTALDGKECDFAQLRGKVVAVVYFRASDQGAVQAFEQWKAFHSEVRKKGFEIVAVSHDPAADREKVAKWVADRKVTWPVYFDGKEAAGDFAPKLIVRQAPSVAIFDQKGLLAQSNLRPADLEPTVRQMLGLSAAVAQEEPMEMAMPTSGGRRR